MTAAENPEEEREPGNTLKLKWTVGLPELISQLGITLAISTYQAGKLIFLTASDKGRIFQIPISFKKPMGIAFHDGKLAVASLRELNLYANSPAMAADYPRNPSVYDALFLPRATYYCGEADIHDISFGDGVMWAVNTRFSCLCTFDINYSFIPRWKPPFITQLRPEDRCHLNGMALDEKLPKYVTALSPTDVPEGWRASKAKQGMVMEVPSGEVVVGGLGMPHSPRLIDGQLFTLLSATGELIKIDPKSNSFQTIASLDGFVRGMDSFGDYIFIGLSKIRASSTTFQGLPITPKAKHAGIAVVSKLTGELVGEIRYEDTVEEIFDVKVIPGIRKPGLINTYDDLHQDAIVSPKGHFWRKRKEKTEENEISEQGD